MTTLTILDCTGINIISDRRFATSSKIVYKVVSTKSLPIVRHMMLPKMDLYSTLGLTNCDNNSPDITYCKIKSSDNELPSLMDLILYSVYQLINPDIIITDSDIGDTSSKMTISIKNIQREPIEVSSVFVNGASFKSVINNEIPYTIREIINKEFTNLVVKNKATDTKKTINELKEQMEQFTQERNLGIKREFGGSCNYQDNLEDYMTNEIKQFKR